MRLFLVSAILATLSLAALPQTAAVAPPEILDDIKIADPLDRPCLVYPGTHTVGDRWVTVPGVYVPGQSRDVLFLHVQTDPVYTTSTRVYVPGTTVVTPGICWDGLFGGFSL